MSDETPKLTRRRVLAGLGGIGAGAALGGTGTMAFLSDEESLDGNMITAGELDLKVDYVVHEDQGSAGTYTINSFTGEINGEPGEVPTLNGEGTAMSMDLDDVKPGDSGYAGFCFNIVDNPAYMWFCGELTNSSENGYTEPEPEDDNGEGELEEAIEAELVYCDLNSSGQFVRDWSTIFSGTLRELLAELSTGVPLDRRHRADIEPGNQEAFNASSPTATNPCICIRWEVPTSVGNEIQGDSLSFDLEFHAQQARHNDGTTNPCGIPTDTGDGFAKIAREFNNDGTSAGGARARYGNNGSSGAWELAVGDEPGAAGEFEQAQYVWTSGQTVDWTVEYDESSDELSFTFDGNTITDTLDDQPDGRMAIQGKADEATVDASIDGLSVGGSSVSLTGPTDVTASNDGTGRQVRHLVVDTDLDGSTSFELEGEATVTLQSDYPGGDEDVAFDVVFE